MQGPHATRIEIDASGWEDVLDFYEAVFAAIHAPEGHGHSPDALNDSMVFGGMNGREPPYDLVITNLKVPDIVRHIDLVREVMAEGRAEFRAQHGHDVDVSIRLNGQPPVR